VTETLDRTRYSWYRPADSGWADRDTVGKIRKALKRLDPKLDLWWCQDWRPDDREHPGRWGIVYWMARARQWSPVFYWEGAAGEFKPISTDCIELLLRKLEECDTAKPGMDVYSIDRAAAFLSEAREKANRRDFMEIIQEHGKDYGKRLQGKLISVGQFGPRSRRSLGVDSSFDQEMRERGIYK
jgi:hypothetical protein